MAKRVQNWMVDQSTDRDFTVPGNIWYRLVWFAFATISFWNPLWLEKMQWPIGYLHTTQILFCTYLLEAKCLSSSKMLVSMHLSGWIEMVKSEFFNSAIQWVAFYFIIVLSYSKGKFYIRKYLQKDKKIWMENLK